jgi:exodeoxyribonuclease-5
MIVLNEGQRKTVDEIVEFYFASGEVVYTLEGHGGTGKTTCIQTAIKEIKEKVGGHVPVCLTAPTNKATKVLRRMARENELQVDSKTIYSILGLVLDSNNEIRYAARMADGSFADYDLVVVDEGSMCDERLWGIIHNEAVAQGVKVVVMGDNCQLGPVKAAASKVFKKGFPGGKLTEIMRQVEGNPILTLAQSIRDAQQDPRLEIDYSTSINAETEQGIYVLPQKQWLDCALDNFQSEEYTKNPDAFRCLAYTNARVNSLNKIIRNLLVGKTETPFIVGERVLVRRPIKDLFSDDRIHTDEECVVLAVSEELHPLYKKDSSQFKVWTLALRSDDGAQIDAHLLHKDSKSDYTKTLDMLSKAANENGSRWKDFWAFKDSFHDLQSPHAMTVHRSQGSTYNNVFVDMRDVYRNRNRLERLQLEYVAVSRASETLIVTK